MSENKKPLGNNPQAQPGVKQREIALPRVKQKVKKGTVTGKGGPQDTGKPEH